MLDVERLVLPNIYFVFSILKNRHGPDMKWGLPSPNRQFMPSEHVYEAFTSQRQFLRLRASYTIELRSTMKLWDVLATCFVLLSIVQTSPLLHPQSTKTTHGWENIAPIHLATSSESPTKMISETDKSEELSLEEYNMEELRPEQFEDVMDFIKVTISRLRGPSHLDRGSRIRRKRERRNGGRGAENTRNRGKVSGSRVGRRKGGREQDCVLKQIHLNVTDLGLGYQTREELIFRYCSGPCKISETNYDKILNNLTQNKRLLAEIPPHACCRPVAFDDDLSFLDDHLMYHTMKKHSARRCACV
ncbi:glial cell line-derived neurotrophic factor [Esox lucius]|uniref:Glial cell line-derived neurotrophic factor n=1 Tax=Esox lucius TaxID=8010 RepID=A0AAY5K0I8_ESOLU|nr:glial cell line-derived neurotrophic factor [Esox lucius]